MSCSVYINCWGGKRTLLYTQARIYRSLSLSLLTGVYYRYSTWSRARAWGVCVRTTTLFCIYTYIEVMLHVSRIHASIVACIIAGGYYFEMEVYWSDTYIFFSERFWTVIMLYTYIYIVAGWINWEMLGERGSWQFWDVFFFSLVWWFIGYFRCTKTDWTSMFVYAYVCD